MEFLSKIIFIYNLYKDLKKHFKKISKGKNNIKEKEKMVNLPDKECARLVEGWKQEGYDVRWCSERNVSSKKSEGYEILYEMNKEEGVKYKIRAWNLSGGYADHLVPMGKKLKK
jgi:hypothetical protein